MGFVLRRRTKGAKSWMNFSASKSNGFGLSQSQKIGDNLTLNFSKRGLTATYNLGNGIRYVKTRKLFSKTKEKKQPIQKTVKTTRRKTYLAPKRSYEPSTPKTLVQRRTNMFRYQLRELYRKENSITQTESYNVNKFVIASIMLLMIGIIVYFV